METVPKQFWPPVFFFGPEMCDTKPKHPVIAKDVTAHPKKKVSLIQDSFKQNSKFVVLARINIVQRNLCQLNSVTFYSGGVY